MNNLTDLVAAYHSKLSVKGRFIKRLNTDFVELLMSTTVLSVFESINEKLWAVKTGTCIRPVCYCGELTRFHHGSCTYHQFCSAHCARCNPATQHSRNTKRLEGGTAAKIQATILTRYGRNGIKELRRQGVIAKYGVDNYFATPEFKDRIVDYNVEKYGVTSYSQTDECKAKYKSTCLTRYGVDHYAKSLDFKNAVHIRYALLKSQLNETYNVEHTSQIKIANILHLISDSEWLYDQYITQNKSTAQLVDELGVCATTVLNYLRKHEIEIKYNFGYSHRCVAWLSEIASRDNIFIQHALNNGEFCIPSTKFRADGYCAETNTIYEFHGDIWHGNLALFNKDDYPNPFSLLSAGDLYTNTLKKEQKIRELGYNLIVIWENEWMAQHGKH